MDGAVVVAALILNPIARRKRAAQGSEPVQTAEVLTMATGGAEGSNSTEKSDSTPGDSGPTVGRNRAEV